MNGNPLRWVDPWGLATWPGSGSVSSPWGPRTDPNSGAQSFHNGADIRNPLGAPVVASDSGTVQITTGPHGENQIIIHNDDRSTSGYSHVDPSTQNGQHVNEGDPIGNTDVSGDSTGPHVHYTYKSPGSNTREDPMNHLLSENNYPSQSSCQ